MLTYARSCLHSIKRLISSIEVPGVTRPHPWVSPLHLSCRFGQAAITFMLLKRGAVANGAGAAGYAPKSPLEVSYFTLHSSHSTSHFKLEVSDRNFGCFPNGFQRPLAN